MSKEEEEKSCLPRGVTWGLFFWFSLPGCFRISANLIMHASMSIRTAKN